MVLARRQIADKSLPAETHQKAQETYRQSLLDEIDHATQLYRLQRQDSRIGFEASNHYYYLPHDLQEKVLNCRQLLQAIEK